MSMVIEAGRNLFQRRDSPLSPSERREIERESKLDKILTDNPLTNADIWNFIRSLKRGSLSDKDRESIIQGHLNYKQFDPTWNPKLSEVLSVAGVDGVCVDPLLQHIGFNYDYALGSHNRFKTKMDRFHKAAAEAHAKGEVSRVEIEYNERFWGVREWVKFEVEHPPINSSLWIYDQEVAPLLYPYEIIKPGKPTIWSYPLNPARVARVWGDIDRN